MLNQIRLWIRAKTKRNYRRSFKQHLMLQRHYGAGMTTVNSPHLEKMYLHPIIPSLVHLLMPGGEIFVFLELFLFGL